MKVRWQDIIKIHLINLVILTAVFASASLTQHLLADNLPMIISIIYVSIAALLGWIAASILLKHETLYLLINEIKKITRKPTNI